jgi:hypothetical protein
LDACVKKFYTDSAQQLNSIIIIIKHNSACFFITKV